MDCHTPGGWTVESDSNGRSYILLAQRRSKRMVVGMGNGLGYDEFKANVLLMATAPELYEALENLLEAAALYFSHQDVSNSRRKEALEYAALALDIARVGLAADPAEEIPNQE